MSWETDKSHLDHPGIQRKMRRFFSVVLQFGSDSPSDLGPSQDHELLVWRGKGVQLLLRYGCEVQKHPNTKAVPMTCCWSLSNFASR